MIQVFWIALRTEIMSLLRMQETYTFGLLPALLVVPVGLGITVIGLSFFGDDTLAIPLEDPPGVDLQEVLEDDFDVLRVENPREAYESGKADAAVLTWSLRDPPVDAWLDAEVLAEEDGHGEVRYALKKAMRAELDGRIEDAGGVGEEVRIVAKVRTGESSDLDFDQRQAFWLWYVFMASYLGCFMIPVRTAAERLSGALESLAVTATPVVVLYTARLLVGTVFFLGLVMLPMFTLFLMGGDQIGGDVRALDIVEAAATVLLANGLYLVCGLTANSVRMALYYGSYMILFISPVFAVPVMYDYPQIPFLGFAEDGGVGWQLLRIAGTLLATAGSLRVVHLLAQGERVLPPGEGDE